MREELYWFWYCSLERMSPLFKARLLKRAGGPEALWRAGRGALRELAGPVFRGRDPEGFVDYVMGSRSRESVERKREEAKGLGIRLIPMTDAAFPPGLACFEDCPAGLFVRGRLPEPGVPAAALVGARSCSFFGREMAERLGRVLAEAGVQVISGLARGIDAAAHAGALEGGGDTFGVLGCGPDRVYPAENRELYRRVEERGGLISEYPPGTGPLAYHFPARNRIISGLSDCVAVLEAGEKSGALITASIALEQGKEVFAVPGRPGDRLSAGTNGLLRDGARILASEDDILSLWGLRKPLRISEKEKLCLDKNLEKVYICLDSELKSIDSLRAETGLSQTVLAGCLVDLELMGLACQPCAGYYSAKRDR